MSKIRVENLKSLLILCFGVSEEKKKQTREGLASAYLGGTGKTAKINRTSQITKF